MDRTSILYATVDSLELDRFWVPFVLLLLLGASSIVVAANVAEGSILFRVAVAVAVLSGLGALPFGFVIREELISLLIFGLITLPFFAMVAIVLIGIAVVVLAVLGGLVSILILTLVAFVWWVISGEWPSWY